MTIFFPFLYIHLRINDIEIKLNTFKLLFKVVNQWIRIARKKPLDSDYAAPDEGGEEDGYNALQDDHIIQVGISYLAFLTYCMYIRHDQY